ncbi:hypothetical protein HGI15_22270 [Modestobacter lapidis]|nr:hypothetical protein [Modestobacter lapidis]
MVAGDHGPGSQGPATLEGKCPSGARFWPFFVVFRFRFFCLFSTTFLHIIWLDFPLKNLMRILANWFAKFPIFWEKPNTELLIFRQMLKQGQTMSE